MKKNTKRLLALLMAAALMIGMCACGESEEPTEETTGMPNPMHECSYDEMFQATNIELQAPEGAENAEYCYIDAASEDGYPIAQVKFTFDGKDYCYRCQMTDALSMYVDVDGNEATPDQLMQGLKDCTNVGAALGGMYCDWESAGTTDVCNRDGVFGFNEGKEGMISWLDVVPGALYSLTMDKGATQSDLQSMAEKAFVPMQGECDGDE